MTRHDGIVHIGGYTAESGGRGSGVVAARRDPGSGGLTPLGTVAETPSPSFLARHPVLPVLYAVNELTEGSVAAWRIGAEGSLTPLGSRPTGGAGPCHLAVAPGGAHLLVANYGGGSVAVLPLDPDGTPGERTDLVVHQGHGADPDRQEKAHTHMVSPDPGRGPLLAVDLGTGYASDADGALHQRGQVPASDRTGHVQPSEVAVGPDGRFLYVANRGVGTVAVFALDGELPELVAEVDTGGQWPRHLARCDDHFYVADERADLVRVFRVDPETGVPAVVGEPFATPSPTCVLP